jgi:phosphoglycerate dehydrogenase-like enzyme
VLAALTVAEVRDFFPEPLWREVQDVGDEFRLIDPVALSPEAFALELQIVNPEILIACWKTPPLPAVLPPRLRYVCYLTGSVKRLVSLAHVQQGLLLSNWGKSISRIVAEGALFHVLSCLRRATGWCIGMHQQGAWKDEETLTASLFGRRVGLHGFGQVARELVKLLQPFDVKISAFAPDVTPAVEREWRVTHAASLDALFSENDIVIEVAPLIPETLRIVQEKHLRLLRPGCVFVNVGRADVVDEAALVRVAQEGRVQFGLDVFSVEPLPTDHPLRGLLNVSLTPHLAGPTTDRRRDAGAWALQNLRAYAAGQPLVQQITAENYNLRA